MILAAGGIGVVAAHNSDDTPAKPSAQVTTMNAAPKTAQDVIQSVLGITQQVQFAGASGQAMSREQIDALINQQLAQLGVNR